MVLTAIFLFSACDIAYANKTISLPSGKTIDLSTYDESNKNLDAVISIQLGTQRDIFLGSGLADIDMEYNGNAISVQKNNGKLTLTAVAVGTGRIVLRHNDITLTILATVESSPSQISNAIDVTLGQGDQSLSFDADGSYLALNTKLNQNLTILATVESSPSQISNAIDVTLGQGDQSLSFDADGSYLALNTKLNQNTNGYELKIDADKQIEVIVAGESAYIASVYTGEFVIGLNAVIDEKVVAHTDVKVNFIEPTLKLDYIMPDLDDIACGNEDIKISVSPVNLNLNRVQVAVGNGIKNTRNVIKYKFDTTSNLNISKNEDGNIHLKPLTEGSASFTITASVQGYRPHIFVRSFNIKPERAKLDISRTQLVLDRTYPEAVAYKTNPSSDLEIIYDNKMVEVVRQNGRLQIRGRELGTGNITLISREQGKTDNTVVLTYNVVEKRLRSNISEEKLPDVLSKPTTLPISGLPSTAHITVGASNTGIADVSLDSSKRLVLKPLKDGKFTLNISATNDGYAPLNISKEIVVELPKLSLETDIDIVEVTEGSQQRFILKRKNGGNLTVKSSNEKIAKVQVSGSAVIVTGVAPGKATLTLSAVRDGYQSAMLSLPVVVGERITKLTVSSTAEAYKDFISKIVAVTDRDATPKVESTGGVEIVDQAFKDGRILITYRATADGNINISAKSPKYKENSVSIAVAFKEKSTKADGLGILYMFSENSGHSVYKHNTIMSNLFSEPPTAMDTVPITTGEHLDELTRLVNGIIAGQSTDRGKAKAIYTWVIKNIYYDYDGLEGKTPVVDNPYNVYKSQKAICTGYSSLYADMLRIAGIPARIIEGQYAYPNSEDWYKNTVNSHAWNEVWLDGRWAMVDSTWGTYYKYKNSTYDSSGGIDTTYRYFDTALSNFSKDHRIDRIVAFYQ